MDIKQLKRFLDLCETNSFTQTARNLYLSQQALSSSMNALEEELDKPLFQRTAKGVILTREGEYLKQACEPVVSNFDRMVLDLNHQFQEKKETLLLGLAPFVLRASSPDLIFKFRTIYPKYLVKATECADITCEKDIMDESVELAFCSRPLDNPAIKYIPVGKEPLYAVVNKASPLALKQQVDLVDLQNEKLISLNKYHQIHNVIMRCCHNYGFTPEFAVETGEVGTLLGLVELNQGVFICMRHITMDIDSNCCAAVPVCGRDAIWEYGLIYKKSRKLSRCAERFIDFVVKNAFLS